MNHFIIKAYRFDQLKRALNAQGFVCITFPSKEKMAPINGVPAKNCATNAPIAIVEAIAFRENSPNYIEKIIVQES